MFCYSKQAYWLNGGTYYPGSIENYNIDNVVMIAQGEDLQSVRHHGCCHQISIIVSVMLNWN